MYVTPTGNAPTPPESTPNLQQVLNEGNTADKPIILNNIEGRQIFIGGDGMACLKNNIGVGYTNEKIIGGNEDNPTIVDIKNQTMRNINFIQMFQGTTLVMEIDAETGWSWGESVNSGSIQLDGTLTLGDNTKKEWQKTLEIKKYYLTKFKIATNETINFKSFTNCYIQATVQIVTSEKIDTSEKAKAYLKGKSLACNGWLVAGSDDDTTNGCSIANVYNYDPDDNDYIEFHGANGNVEFVTNLSNIFEVLSEEI